MSGVGPVHRGVPFGPNGWTLAVAVFIAMVPGAAAATSAIPQPAPWAGIHLWPAQIFEPLQSICITVMSIVQTGTTVASWPSIGFATNSQMEIGLPSRARIR